jgi:hypothetical protein
VRQHAAERVLGDLREETLRQALDLDEPPGELGRRQQRRPAQAMPATRATSRSTWPFAQSLPRRTIGTERMPSAASSAKPSLSSSTLTETKGTPCRVGNSFILRQLVQPGCQ